MKYDVFLSSSAEDDLRKAVDYIDRVLMNPGAADGLLSEAERRFGELETFPRKYALVDDPVLKKWGVRLVTVKEYLVFYVIREEKRRVDVVRFLHSRRNWAGILKQGAAE